VNPHALPFVMSAGFLGSAWACWWLVGRFLPPSPRREVLEVMAENARLKRKLDERSERLVTIEVPNHRYRKGLYIPDEWRETMDIKERQWREIASWVQP
jgi:hypothetical protein